METFGNLETLVKYSCIECDFHSSQKIDLDRHLLTRKHKAGKNGKLLETFSSQESVYQCPHCNCSFLSHSGLWKHSRKGKCQQKCLKPEECSKPVECPKPEEGQQQHLIDFLRIMLKRDEEREKERQEEKKELVQLILKRDDDKELKREEMTLKRDKEIVKLVTEALCKTAQLNASQTITNSNNVITDNNNCFNTFNLNLFLNETCKDAVNLSDFIKNVKIGLADMERIGQIGYVNGLSQVINQNLNLLGVEKRPIHCTDAKRQTLYIKEDNEWTKEDSTMPRIQYLIDEVQKANLRLLGEWKLKHPGCLTSNSIYTDNYNNLSQELLGGCCKKVSMAKKDEKIKNLILKDVIIDKQSFLNAFTKI